ncbi:MAG: DUF11 domain-containing protein, partial [Chloroflexota bacterium]|nr:DUF11 domain-containing protein [Chloroflexota bacterium]
PTPSPTPTPPPSLALTLENSPKSWVAPGQEISYILRYTNNGVNNATDVTIASTIPADTELIPESIQVGAGGTYMISNTNNEVTILWTVGTVANNAGGSVAYRVRRVLPPKSPVPRALAIAGDGPDSVNAGAPIVYRITVTNNVPITLTDLMIFDALPAGAIYVSGGDGPPIDNVVKWSVPALAPDTTITREVTVTAVGSLINSNYGVITSEGANVQGRELVITTVAGRPLPPTGDGSTIVNPKAVLGWRTNGISQQTESNPVFNPTLPVYLPMVRR